jgi:purine-cytosine permease-like protein
MMPNSISWVLVVIVLGSVIAVVAAKGYNTVSRFANVASPWMVLVFLACGISALPELGIKSMSDFWPVANSVIWNGKPIEGQSQFTFWHVFFFAWFCNMAMHIGMADLSIFRYAKKSWHAISTSAGMYIGHFMAWMSASMLYAIQLNLDATNTTVAPGPMAVNIAGLTGALCVIIAGWTTANPTIYRSGLAFQSLIPKSSRATATLIAGGLATLAGLFPALAMKLLDFVALYGLVLMPMGAVILIDFWVLPKLGLKSFFAEAANLSINWAAGAAWVLTLALCVVINKVTGLEIFFLALPGWFLAAIIYIVGSMMIQKKSAA